jgi:hypothetical protein
MKNWFLNHRIIAFLLLTVLTLAVTEGVLLFVYLGSWLTLPLI